MFVVAGGDAAPLLQARESSFDDVAVSIVVMVVTNGATAAGASAQAVSDLVCGLRNDGLDAAVAQVLTDRSGRVGLVASDAIGSGSRATDCSRNAKLLQQRDQHRRVPGLAGSHGDHQGQSVAVDEVVELGR